MCHKYDIFFLNHQEYNTVLTSFKTKNMPFINRCNHNNQYINLITKMSII